MSRPSLPPPPRPFYEEKMLPDPVWTDTTHNIQDSTLAAIEPHDGTMVVVRAETGTNAGTYAKNLASRLATMAALNGKLTTCLSVTGSEAHGRDLFARLKSLQYTPDHLTVVIGNDVHTVAPYQAFLNGILISHHTEDITQHSFTRLTAMKQAVFIFTVDADVKLSKYFLSRCTTFITLRLTDIPALQTPPSTAPEASTASAVLEVVSALPWAE